MSGIYIPGSFCKKKLTVEISEVHSLEEKKVEQDAPKELESQPQVKPEPEKVIRTRKPAKEVISMIKPVEVKQLNLGLNKSFVECLKTASSKPLTKENSNSVKNVNISTVYMLKEIKEEEFDIFMQKYDAKLRKFYEKVIYYENDFFSKLRINGDQGYITFCKFMYNVV